MTSFREHFVDALDAYRSVAEYGEGEWKRYWDSLELAAEGGEAAFVVARQFARSSESERHHVAVDLVGRIAALNPGLREQCVDVVLEAIGRSQDAILMSSCISALGHTRSSRAVPFLMGCMAGNDAALRATAVVALACCVDDSPTGRNALIYAMASEDVEMRRIATFAISVNCSADTDAVREALVARLFETDDEVRNEAIRGLAKRGDDRARLPVEHALQSRDPAPQIMRAAELLGIATD